jgi:hypothetical protein
MYNSKWNMSTRTLPKGALVFVFGLKVNGTLHAQLVLFATPMRTTMPTPTPTMTSMPATPGMTAVPPVTGSSPAFSGQHS